MKNLIRTGSSFSHDLENVLHDFPAVKENAAHVIGVREAAFGVLVFLARINFFKYRAYRSPLFFRGWFDVGSEPTDGFIMIVVYPRKHENWVVGTYVGYVAGAENIIRRLQRDDDNTQAIGDKIINKVADVRAVVNSVCISRCTLALRVPTIGQKSLPSLFGNNASPQLHGNVLAGMRVSDPVVAVVKSVRQRVNEAVAVPDAEASDECCRKNRMLEYLPLSGGGHGRICCNRLPSSDLCVCGPWWGL